MPRDTFETITESTELFKTRDGAEIIGRLFRPSHAPFAVVILNGATGVPQKFYGHFARWLADERGLACLTYDYRDMGLSASGPVRKSLATMGDWGVTDAEAARAAAKRLIPDVPIWCIGHSLGTMLIPAQENASEIARIIGIASGMVTWHDHPWPYRFLPSLFWYGPGPIATALAGYLPGRLLGFGPDMPASAYWQWRKWCTHPDCFAHELGRELPDFDLEPLTRQIRFFSFSDDALCPPICTERLSELYGGVAHQTLDPGDHGLTKIGHLDYFAPRNRALWPIVLQP